MSDGMLSQDEIDALLNIGNDEKKEPNNEEEEELAVSDYLTSLEKDALGEIGNISFGSSATTLSTLLNHKVEITTPEVSVAKRPLDEAFPFEHISLQVNYVEGFTGANLFVIKKEDASIIADIMLGGDGTNPEKELNEIHLSAVQEAMNQMMGASATSMSTVFEQKIDISPPTVSFENIEKVTTNEADTNEEVFVKVSFQLIVGDLIDSNIMQLIPLSFAKELVDQLLNSPGESTEETTIHTSDEMQRIENTNNEKTVEQEQGMIEKEQLKEQNQSSNYDNRSKMEEASPQFIGDSIHKHANVQQASFSDFEQVQLNDSEKRNLDMLLDIPLQVTVELGRTNRTVQEILDLSNGSIIELDKLAGEPVDVLINDKLVAKGEVVVIEENFGVRVSDIVSQTDRLLKLK